MAKKWKRKTDEFKNLLVDLQNALENPNGDDLANAKQIVQQEERLRKEAVARVKEKLSKALDKM